MSSSSSSAAALGAKIAELVERVALAYHSRAGAPVNHTVAAFVLRAVLAESAGDAAATLPGAASAGSATAAAAAAAAAPAARAAKLSDAEEAKVVRESVERLCEAGPALDALRLQIDFDECAQAVIKEIDEHLRRLSDSFENLLTDACDTKARGVAGADALFRRLVAMCAAAAHVPNEDTKGLKATASALESVLPRTELSALSALPARQKAAQLRELADIVVGILLFNAASGRSVQVVPEDPYEAKALAESELSFLKSEEELVAPQVDLLERILTNSKGGNASLRDQLLFRRQFVSSLRQLSEDISTLLPRIAEQTDQYANQLASLQAALEGQTAVPAAQIYPQFATLAEMWRQLASDALLMRARTRLRESILPYQPGEPEIDPYFMRLAVAPTDLSRDDADVSAVAAASNVELVPRDLARTVPLSLSGYCPATLVDRDRLLLLGDRNYVARIGDQAFAMRSEAELRRFARTPHRYVVGVVQLARRNPELIQLLGLADDMPDMPNVNHYSALMGGGGGDGAGAGAAAGAGDTTAAALAKLQRLTAQVNRAAEPVMGRNQASVDVQTELHPVPQHIDRNYTFSEWELRRRALALARLRNKATHSTQTERSHFQRDSTTQVFLPTETATQTAVNAGTNPIRRKNHIAGLRGAPGTKCSTFTLELELQ